LSHPGPGGTKIPVRVGDSLEINNHRAVVVGIGRITPGFYPQPIVFTTYTQFKRFTSRSGIDFIVAKTDSEAHVDAVIDKVNLNPYLNGLSRDQMKWRIAKSFLKTGILINFGLSVALGIIIGFSISGQIFYVMTIQNLVYYALI